MKLLLLLSNGLLVGSALAQSTASTNYTLPTQPAWKEVGQLKTRDAREIKASTWSIGCEVLDRDFCDYHAYKSYLGPLGAKRARFQGGWAKCEKVKGQYDFVWLDAILPDAVSRGVQPWVEFSYGNPIYGEEGGQPKLGGKFPYGSALPAWEAWVRGMVNRYKGSVKEWEIWNEPDIDTERNGNKGDAFADFYIRTAEIVRQIDPQARLLALGLAQISRTDFIVPFMERLKEKGKLKLIDVLTYHGYAHNPDDSYPQIEKFRALVHSYNPKIILMQGENGAPSEQTTGQFALNDKPWSELTQTKWNLRRMLGDHGRSIETNLFTMSDMAYKSGDFRQGINRKGMVKIRSMDDMSIERPKLVYFVVQRVFSLFDDQLETLVNTKPTVDQETVNAFAYRHKANGGSLVTLWSKEARPAEAYTPKPTTLTIEGRFRQPVFVDLITGKAYEIPQKQWAKKGQTHTFTGLPVPDYPVLVADKGALILQ